MPTFSNTPIPVEPTPEKEREVPSDATPTAIPDTVSERALHTAPENLPEGIAPESCTPPSAPTKTPSAEHLSDATAHVPGVGGTKDTTQAATPEGSSFRIPPADSVTVHHFRTAPPESPTRLNADLGLSLDAYRFSRLQLFFRDVAKRDPTVGELRLLDSLDRLDCGNPSRVAVGELITPSDAIAAAWAEMMDCHGALHDVGHALRGTVACAAPPCTLTDAIALTGRSLYRSGLRKPTDNGDPVSGGRTVLLASPRQEAVAAAQGYHPVARILVGKNTRSLWVRTTSPREQAPERRGDYLLYIPALTVERVSALYDRLAVGRTPMGALCAVSNRPLLLSILELCPSVDLYADRLIAHHDLPRDGHVPVELLCAAPIVEEDGTADYLLRVPLKQLRPASEMLKALHITAVICGQAITGKRTVIRVKNVNGTEDVPVVELPTEFIRATYAVYLHRYEVPRQAKTPAAPTFPAMTRFPSPCAKANGLTPDGRELVALTLHEGRVLAIPEAQTAVSAAAARVPAEGMGYTAAAEAAAAATDALAQLGVKPEAMVLSVSVTLPKGMDLTDSRLPEVLCGLYRLAADRLIPIDDPVIHREDDGGTDLRVLVAAWARDPAVCAEPALAYDRQWKASGYPVHKESPCFLLPVLRRSYENSLQALSAALNRDFGAGCEIRPVLIDATAEDADRTVPRLNSASVKELCERIFNRQIPVFAMNEEDTRTLLAEPAVSESLNRLLEWGYPLLVLGESCKPFAEQGFLPACLTDLADLPTVDTDATVTYRLAADSATRRIRGRLLAPTDADGQESLLILHLPDGTRVPDGFTGRDSKVLGLLNGLDTALLPLLRGKNRFNL